MGNDSSKMNKNFFEEIKTTTSYRDFVIKMNQLISRSNVSWDFSFEQINPEELPLYEDLIKHFLIFTSDYIFENTHKKAVKDKESLQMIQVFLDILRGMFIFMTVQKPKWFFENFWMRTSPDIVVEPVMDELGSIKNILVDKKDYIGSNEQLTLAMKLLTSVNELLFTNDFCVEYKIEDKGKLANTIAHSGWNKSSNKSKISRNRISVLEFILTFIMVDKKLNEIHDKRINSVLYFFKNTKYNDIFIKSLLKTGCDYQENGILPYSAYFFKEQMENQMYMSALCLNVALLLLGEDPESAKAEAKSKENHLSLYLVKIYMKSRNSIKEINLADIFDDEAFLQVVLQTLSTNLVSLYYSNKSVLPNSYKEV